MARKKTSTKTNTNKISSRLSGITSAMRGGTSRLRERISKTSSGTPAKKPTQTTKKTSTTRKRATAKNETVSPPRPRLTNQQKALWLGISCWFISLFLILSLLSGRQGRIPTAVYDAFRTLFGWGGYLVPFTLVIAGLFLILWGTERQLPKVPPYRVMGAVLLFLVGESFLSMGSVLLNNNLNDVWQVAQAGLGGGLLGASILSFLGGVQQNLGATFVLTVMGFLGAILVTGVTRDDASQFLHWLARKWQTRGQQPATVTPQPVPAVPTPPQAEQLPLPTAVSEPAPVAEKPKKRVTRRRKKKEEPQPTAPQVASVSVTIPSLAEQSNGQVESGESNGRPQPNWKIPAVSDMLHSGTDPDVNSSAIREQVEIIEQTLQSFGAPATVVDINQGPTIIQYGVEPNYLQTRGGKRTKVKVGKIASLSDDLALALAAKSIRIQAPVPGKGYVGIEIPTPAKAVVSLRDVIEDDAFQKIKNAPLRIGLGQNVGGQPIATDLTKMPHLLVAGTTGSGKSVCVNAIIACLLLHNTPETLKLVMIDPKRVELTGYNGIPHLAAPVVVEMEKVIGTLQWAMSEMDNRYKLFANIGARNIIDYNQKIKKVRPSARLLPYVVIIIDELADLMMLAPEDTEKAIARLAQMARATGIHMIIATQRPSVDVVTGLIKANFPARIAFAVASSTDSRVILDSTGAEQLLGQGDMLFQSPDAANPVRLQGCYVSDTELDGLITYWQQARRFNIVSPTETTLRKTTPKPPAPQPDVPAIPPPVIQTRKTEEPATQSEAKAEPKSTSVKKTDTPQVNVNPSGLTQAPLIDFLEDLAEEKQNAPVDDELYFEAVALVRKLKKASTSLLQRRFRIGYTRAARLMDAMEVQEIIGPPTGTSKAREVLPWSNSEESQEAEPTPDMS